MKLKFILILVCSQLSAMGDINIKSQIKAVTVYTNSAQIHAAADANINKGSYNLVFEDVSPLIDENSIQVSGNADFTILSISVKKDFLNEGFKDATLKKLEDSLVVLQLKISQIVNLTSALNEELNLLHANQKVGGNNSTLLAADLEKMSTFYRNRIEEIRNRLYDAGVAQNKMQLRVNEVQNQINTYNTANTKNKADILVSIKSNFAGKVDFELSYNVAEAGWTPFYDIKAESTSAPISIFAKAIVYQNTGDQWKDVKLFISTGNPNVSNVIPMLNPYYIYPQPENNNVAVRGGRSKATRGDMPAAAPAMYGGALDKADSVEETYSLKAATTADYTWKVESSTTNIYEISIPYTIKSDGNENVVDIQKFEVPAKFNYVTKPKLESAVFLEARITDWNQSGLLPGDASVYFEGNYIGKTYFETSVASDTMSLSFGRDNNITVQRKRTKFLNDKTIVGTTKLVNVEFEIVVKNRKKSNVDLVIEDQLPLSSNTNTDIEPSELSKAVYNKETGNLKWNTTLKAGESNSIKFGFKVSYPKGYVISTNF